MNIINLEHICKTFGEKLVFDDISYGIHENDKIGVIGINGTGKTTFLRMIAGEEEPDEGKVIRQNGLKIAYLSQHQEFPENISILEYMVSQHKGKEWTVESDAKNILNHLGVTDSSVCVDTLSGGQKKRVALAHVLLETADVLILDEPTNHLDEEMVIWLENFLRRYRGVVIMVTHDRYFLDKVSNKILEISHGKLYAYESNYSGFLELKAQREEMEMASERKRQSILRIEMEWAKRGCRARTTKQRARLERLEALKQNAAPAQDSTVEMDSIETRMGKKTIELHHISKSYGDKKILDDWSYIFLRNQRVGIVGPNGCGKSTLMKMIAGILPPDSGTIEVGETIRIGYFAQEEVDMDPNERVIDYIKDIAEYIPTREGKISASQLLERFLFDGSMQYSPIGKLSGGEKRRLYLLRVLAQGANVYIFDEPGNNLDIPTLTILEDYLNSFVGIVITVSHDRYFLDNVADRIFAFDGDGKLRQYEGGYTEYFERRQQEMEEVEHTSDNHGTKTKQKKEAAKDWKQNRQTKLKFTFKEQKEFETIDADIAKLEEKLTDLEKQINANANDYPKLVTLTVEKEEIETQLEDKMDRWVYLNDLAERIEAQNKVRN